MAGNPQIPQGVINRLRGSLSVTDSPSLNVSASFLGKGGISMQLEGQATGQLPTMTGVVNSPEPYMMISVKMILLKTQALSAIWKTRMQLDTQLGDVIITPDAKAIGTFQIQNASIESVDGLSFAGDSAEFPVMIKGVWLLNSALWDLLAS